jgi:hypothetical protein
VTLNQRPRIPVTVRTEEACQGPSQVRPRVGATGQCRDRQRSIGQQQGQQVAGRQITNPLVGRNGPSWWVPQHSEAEAASGWAPAGSEEPRQVQHCCPTRLLPRYHSRRMWPAVVEAVVAPRSRAEAAHSREPAGPEETRRQQNIPRLGVGPAAVP